jgi:hypothetical protein
MTLADASGWCTNGTIFAFFDWLILNEFLKPAIGR